MKKQESQERRPFSLGLGALLIGGSVTFVSLVTVILVLFALVSAREAAIEPLRQSTGLVVEALAERTRDHLQAARLQGNYITGLVAAEIASGAGTDRIEDTLVASLAAAPQVYAVVFMRPNLSGVEVRLDQGGRPIVSILDITERPNARAYVDEVMAAMSGGWGAPFELPSEPGLTLLNYRVPVRMAPGTPAMGIVVVTLRSDRLSRFMRDLARPPIRSAFILYGNDKVLAHPSFESMASTSLPNLAQMPDATMRAIQDDDSSTGFFGHRLDTASLTVKEVDGRPVLYLFRDLLGFAPEPLRVGAYVNLDDVGVAPQRFQMIALVGLSIVAAAAVMAALLARRLAAAIRDLSDVAASVARFELGNIHQPSRSHVRELDELGQAFAAMLRAMAAFAIYVPRQLVRQLLAAGRSGELISEQRELTVLFTDLSGFSRMAENRPAAETARLLNDHFARVTACIEAEGGTVDKFLGDAVMAFWGAPERQADHAIRAIRAAAAMQRAYQDDPMRRDFGLGLRIGIHTGVVLVGDIGSPERLNYTIIGDAVNVASRLVELCHDYGQEGQVVTLVTEHTVQSANAFDLVEDLGDHTVRGRFRGERVFRLLADRPPARRDTLPAPAGVETPS